MKRSRTGVLFMQSQAIYGADSFIHGLLMRELNRAEFDVHAACTRVVYSGTQAAALRVREIPEVHVRPTSFGPTAYGGNVTKVLYSLPQLAPAAVDLPRLAAYIRRNNIKLIHCTEKPRDAFYGVLLAKLTRTRAIVHMHVMLHELISSRVRWAINNAHALVGISDFVSGTLVEAGIPRERIFTIPNSIDVRAWDPHRDGAPLRSQFGIPDDALVITIASRLFKWKGHRELFSALPPVFARFPKARLVVVGDDDHTSHPGGGSFTAELRELARSLDIEERVTFTGYLSDMEGVFAMSDIFAMPSFEEPFGLVFAEAMAMQRPVVALRSGGAPEVLADGETGLLSDPGDSEALTANLLRLAASEDERRRMGLAGRARVERLFAPGRLARDMEDAYRAILGGRAPEKDSASGVSLTSLA